MTDRVKGLVVTLDSDYREDDIQKVIDAIALIKGVLKVDLCIVGIDDHINRSKIKMEYSHQIIEALKELQ